MFQKELNAVRAVLLDTKMKGAAQAKTWLISERGNDARDNGFAFFRFMMRRHPEKDPVYIISRKSPDFERASASGPVIEPGSKRHLELLYQSEALISTHPFGYTPDMVLYDHLARHGLFHAKGFSVFLQHGITDKDIPWLYRENYKPDMFCTAAYPEYDIITEKYGQPANVVKKTGFARYDDLLSTKPGRYILIMPTWRDSLQKADKETFLRSEFYTKWKQIFRSKELIDVLKEEALEAVVYLHPEMQKFRSCFEWLKPPFQSADPAKVFLPDLIHGCRVLVTDYSSVYFDAAYMEKPVVFYQFDQDRYDSGHYKGRIVRPSMFGPVCEKEKETVDAVFCALEEKRRIPPDGFYFYHDTNNCERIFEEIEKGIRQKKKTIRRG